MPQIATFLGRRGLRTSHPKLSRSKLTHYVAANSFAANERADRINIGGASDLYRARILLLILLICAVVESLISTSALAYAIGGVRWPADVPCSGDACLGQPFTLRYSYANMFDGELLMPDNTSLPNDIIKE